MGRLGSALLLLLAVTATAAADASLPALPGSAGRRGGAGTGQEWRGRCAERLEQARDQAAKKVAVFAAGHVEAWARERAAPGDPTATQLVDVIELRVAAGDGLQLLARVEPDDGQLELPADAWIYWPGHTPDGWNAVMQFSIGSFRGSGTSALVRRAHGWRGILTARTGTEAAVLRIFASAIEDCVAMIAPARGGRR